MSRFAIKTTRPVQTVYERAVALRAPPAPPLELDAIHRETTQPRVAPAPIARRVQPLHIAVAHYTRRRPQALDRTTRTEADRVSLHRIRHAVTGLRPGVERADRDQPGLHRAARDPPRVRLVAHPPELPRINLLGGRISPATTDRVQEPQPQRQPRRVLASCPFRAAAQPRRPQELVHLRRIPSVRAQQKRIGSSRPIRTHQLGNTGQPGKHRIRSTIDCPATRISPEHLPPRRF